MVVDLRFGGCVMFCWRGDKDIMAFGVADKRGRERERERDSHLRGRVLVALFCKGKEICGGFFFLFFSNDT